MGDKSGIEWCDATWNPLVGCSVISPGCTHCYAMKMAARLEAMGSPIYKGLTQQTKGGAVWTGKIEMSNWGQVTAPLRWKKPRRIFVNSMSDLFHEDAKDEWIDQIFAVMALCPQHTFQVLTKRSRRMREYMDAAEPRVWHVIRSTFAEVFQRPGGPAFSWPLPNLWLGVSTEDQARADERIPDLLATPAAARFISAEPLLGPIDLHAVIPSPLAWNFAHGFDGLDWVIIGGESGPRARDFRLSWAKSLIEQCRAANVPAFMKQVGSNAWDDISYVGSTPRFPTRDRKGGSPDEWPTSLQVREMPA